LFGFALVAFAFPYLNDMFAEIARRSEATISKGF
jgi:hypothetical protein